LKAIALACLNFSRSSLIVIIMVLPPPPLKGDLRPEIAASIYSNSALFINVTLRAHVLTVCHA
jgi:hypothetical protein